MEFVQQAIHYIRSYSKFVVLGHVSPDGDCVGSQLALTFFLRRLGKEAYAASLGSFHKKEVKAYEGLFVEEILEEWNDFAVIIVDCATFTRTGFKPFGIAVMSIDHHSSIEEGYIPGILDVNSPSTTLLVQRLIEAYGVGIDESEADLLFLGFATDTGFFRHLKAGSGEYVRQVSRLIDKGVSPSKTYSMIESGYTLSDRKYLGILLSSSSSYEDDRIIIVQDNKSTYLGSDVLRDTDTLYRLLLSADKSEVVMVFSCDESSIIIGLRSKSYVDVGVIARQLGGGGHMRASGCVVDKKNYTLEQLQNFLLQEVKNQLYGYSIN